MSVAPMFQKWPITCGVYIKNGRRYVKVRNPKTGAEREVRWYTESGFLNDTPANADDGPDTTKPFDMLKHARGFDNGPILIIRGYTQEDEDWLGHSVARFAVDVGWYIVSTDTMPADFPKHFRFLLLSWDEFHMEGDERRAKPAAEIRALLDTKELRKEWFKIK